MNIALEDLLKIIGRQTIELEFTRAENAGLRERIIELESKPVDSKSNRISERMHPEIQSANESEL